MLRSTVRGEGSGAAASRRCPSRRAEGARESPGLAGSRCAPRPGQPPRCRRGSRCPRSRCASRPALRPGRCGEQPIWACLGGQLTAGETASPRGSRAEASGKTDGPAGGCDGQQLRGVLILLPAGAGGERVRDGGAAGRGGGSRASLTPSVQVDAGERSLQIPGCCWRRREGAP